MPFLGTTPTQGFVGANPKQSFTANGSTTVFTLTNPVASANDLEVFVGNVRQEPTAAYTAAGTTLTMSEAPATGLNFYVINKSQAQVTTNTPDGSVSSAKIVDGSITSAKLANDAVINAKIGTGAVGTVEIADGTVTSTEIAANAVGSNAIDLTAAYTYTGTFKTNNGFVLLATKSDSSAVNYNSNVDLVDFSSYTSDYRKFFYTIDFYPTSGGNYHLFQYFKLANSASQLSCRVVCNGWLDNNSIVTPNTGVSTYLRTWYQAAGPGIAGHISGYIFNGQRSDADYDCGVMGTSNYHYSGQGNATLHFSAMPNAGSAAGIGKIGLNLDAVGHSNDLLGKATCKVWGMG